MEVKLMAYNLKSTIKKLEQEEEDKKKEGYVGDAAEKAFRRHCLLLLNDIKTQLKENAKQYKYLWQTLEDFGVEKEE